MMNETNRGIALASFSNSIQPTSEIEMDLGALAAYYPSGSLTELLASLLNTEPSNGNL